MYALVCFDAGHWYECNALIIYCSLCTEDVSSFLRVYFMQREGGTSSMAQTKGQTKKMATVSRKSQSVGYGL